MTRWVLVLLIGSLVAGWSQTSEFQPSGKPILTLFGDYFYKVSGEEHVYSKAVFSDEPKDFQAFLIRRVYLGYQYRFTPHILGKIIIEGNDAILNNRGSRSVYVKYAYIDVQNVIPLPFVRGLEIGAIYTPSWRFSEKLYGYRFLERTPFDMRKFGSSNDAGIKVYGSFDQNGAVNYEIMVGNGRNGKPENNKYKRFYVSLQGKVLAKKLWYQLYGDYENMPVEEEDRTVIGALTHWKVFAGADLGAAKAGFEAAYQRLKGEATEKSSMVLSAFVRYAIASQLEYLVRADYYDPDVQAEQKYTELFVVTGLRWEVAPKVVLMPNVWINSYRALGGVPTTPADVVLRLTFYWKY